VCLDGLSAGRNTAVTSTAVVSESISNLNSKQTWRRRRRREALAFPCFSINQVISNCMGHGGIDGFSRFFKRSQ